MSRKHVAFEVDVLIEKENEVMTETLNDMLKGIELGHLAEKFKTEGIDLNLVLDMVQN